LPIAVALVPEGLRQFGEPIGGNAMTALAPSPQAVRAEIARRREGQPPLSHDMAIAGGRVDKANAIIFGVRILGEHSSNRRRYTPEAMRQAVADGLYENCAVYLNHGKGPHEHRSPSDNVGWLQRIRLEAGAIKGDLHLFPAHPLTAHLLDAAQRKEAKLGLSHNADGLSETAADGTTVVKKITNVRSVDLVTQPATNRNLFESVQPASQLTLWEQRFGRKTAPTLREQLARPQAKRQPTLLEMRGRR
jgi:hypothetical protein